MQNRTVFLVFFTMLFVQCFEASIATHSPKAALLFGVLAVSFGYKTFASINRIY